RGLHSVVVVVGHEVDVATLVARVGVDGGVVVAHPGRVCLVVGRIGPHAGDDGGKAHVPVTERRLVGADPMHGAVDRVDVHRRVDDRHLRPVLDVGVDGRV